MEGSEELRREYAVLSRDWVCRECGGSNEERIRELWDVCREKGVEIDVEGVEGGNDEGREEEETEHNHDTQGSPAVPEPETSSSTDSIASPAAPAPAPVSQPVERFASTPMASVPASSPASTQLNSRPRPQPTTASPANSPWLDRAIIGVVVALIILVLRRTIDIEDL